MPDWRSKDIDEEVRILKKYDGFPDYFDMESGDFTTEGMEGEMLEDALRVKELRRKAAAYHEEQDKYYIS